MATTTAAAACVCLLLLCTRRTTGWCCRSSWPWWLATLLPTFSKTRSTKCPSTLCAPHVPPRTSRAARGEGANMATTPAAAAAVLTASTTLARSDPRNERPGFVERWDDSSNCTF
ncbi:hypothetical protein Y032_0568g43 [Ancylostoma ceylanicum]|uniref:Secreted protein n=1 Tax=Ancylostoma ceylanicum TaxID=53326 RepID=A0A016WQB4_9BILA|nr:hypothetical protein Y032_0568g43 [Ancylostoma ceylanicum]